jgi:hypothetical protein
MGHGVWVLELFWVGTERALPTRGYFVKGRKRRAHSRRRRDAFHLVLCGLLRAALPSKFFPVPVDSAKNAGDGTLSQDQPTLEPEPPSSFPFAKVLEKPRASAFSLRSRMVSLPTILSFSLLLSAALFLLFSSVCRLAATTLCCADDAYIAVAAKNLAAGHGYSSSYPVLPTRAFEVREFDPMISTGPTLVLPAAAAIAIFGNQYWVPGLVVLLGSTILLVLFCLVVLRVLPTKARGFSATFLFLLMIEIVTIRHQPHWFALLGELPAAFLACLSLILVGRAGPAEKKGKVFLMGLILGLAFLTKMLAALILPVALAALASGARTTTKGGLRWAALRESAAPAAVFLAAFLILPVGFETWKIASLGAHGYVDNLRATSAFMSETGALRHDTAKPLGEAIERVAARSASWAQAMGGTAAWTAALGALLVILLGSSLRRECAERASLLLGAGASINFLWWLSAAGAARGRYLLIGQVLWCAAVAINICSRQRVARSVAVALLAFWSLAPHARELSLLVPSRPFFQPDARTRAMLETAAFLEARESNSVLVADWWATAADLEYLSSGWKSFVFHDHLRDVAAAQILFVGNEHWLNLGKVQERWSGVLRRHRAERVFERGPYRVFRAR